MSPESFSVRFLIKHPDKITGMFSRDIESDLRQIQISTDAACSPDAHLFSDLIHYFYGKLLRTAAVNTHVMSHINKCLVD